MKGRKVFGELVPYGEIWRTGANAATKLTFSDDIMIGGKELKKGSYALLTKPGEKSWEVMLYPHTSSNYGAYLESKETPVSFMVNPISLSGPAIETLTMGFSDLSNHGGNFYIMWENTRVAIPIKVNTDKAVEASIAKVMGGPSASDYYSAANYYYTEKKDLNKALERINKSISMGNERYWVLRTKSLIQADLGDTKGAIETATKSLEMAKADDDGHYVRMNEASIAEWKKKK
jgi:tetratricopeptide (TPR) repeat protein